MPIIKQDKSEKDIKIKFSVKPSLLNEIKEYCKWVSVNDIGIFFEQEAEFILKKDQEWKKYKKDKSWFVAINYLFKKATFKFYIFVMHL